MQLDDNTVLYRSVLLHDTISKVSSLFSCLIKSGTLTKLSKNSSPNHFEEIYILTVSKLRIEGGFNWLVVSEEAISN
jgi:hypothetical protein